MVCLSIGMADAIEEIKQIIENTAIDLKEKEVDIKVDRKKTNELNFLNIELQCENKQNHVKIYVANIIAKYIIERYEEKFLLRIINANYCYFNAVERKEILEIAKRNIICTDDNNIFNNLFLLRRKNMITKKLIEYFETSSEIVLDGFITFRLKEYIKELEDVVDKAVDDYMMEKEYKEFIRLLKYFVEIQEPKCEVVHVRTFYNHQYSLLDAQKNEITNECIKDFVNEVSEGEINYDDLLVSSLITLAPKKIVIHLEKHITNRQLLETIKNVFFGKVCFCQGCEICISEEAINIKSPMTEYLRK